MSREVRVDLRSDTVTTPTPEMRAAMADAEVGDDVWGDDPTVGRLEALAAAILAKEAALFTPSGTMANQIAISVHTKPGTEVICGARSHAYRAELAGAALHSGVQLRPLADGHGVLDPNDVADAYPLAFHEGPPIALVCLENSYGAGGYAVPVRSLDAVADVAADHGTPVHLDGARLFNAAVALDAEPASLAARADSVMFCVSKGLGAPVGSLLCGSAEFVATSRLVRQRLGGGMRQAGVIAAAGIVALETRVAGLAEDHARAQRLARGIEALCPGAVDVGEVETNMVFARVDHLPRSLLDRLAERGVLAGLSDRATVRFVTHHQVDDAGIDHVLAVLASLV